MNQFKTHEDYLNYYRKYRKENLEKIKAYQKDYHKKWRKENIECLRNYEKNWRINNRDKKRESDRKYAKTERKIKRKLRRKIDLKYRLNSNMSSVISNCLKGKKAGKKWQDLVGYTLTDLMKHLESRFEPWMNWKNYGKWHIDHIKPQSLFNYKTAEDKEFKECWALNNLQPMEKIANIKKGNRF